MLSELFRRVDCVDHMPAAIASNMPISERHTTCAETRGTLNCNLGETFLGNIPGAAHCLRFDALYYQVSFLLSFLPCTYM